MYYPYSTNETYAHYTPQTNNAPVEKENIKQSFAFLLHYKICFSINKPNILRYDARRAHQTATTISEGEGEEVK